MSDDRGLYQRKGSPIWYIRYADQSGKIQRESTEQTDKDEARKIRRARLVDIDRGIPTPAPQTKRITVRDLLDNHLRVMQIDDLETIEENRRDIENELNPEFGQMEARHLTTQHIQNFIIARQEAGLSNSRIRGLLAPLSHALTLASKQTPPLIPYKITFTWPPKAKERKGFYTDEEFEKLCKHLSTPDRIHALPVVRLLLLTGCRVSELLGRPKHHKNKTAGRMGLEWRNVDLKDELASFTLGKTKNGDERLIPLVPEAREILENLWQERMRAGVLTPWVFTYEGRPLASIKTAFDSAREEAGLPEKTLHDCRRTFGRKLRQSGIPDKLGMLLMGHRDYATYQKYYPVIKDDLRGAVLKLAK